MLTERFQTLPIDSNTSNREESPTGANTNMGKPVRIHLPCPHENCKSTDAASVYEDENGVISGHCFSCQQYIKPSLVEEFYHEGYEKKENRLDQEQKDYILSLECRGWRERRVGKEVSELYRIRTEFDNKNNVVKRYYPVTENGELTGYHVRDCVNKNFYTIGKNKTSSEFFGQALFSGGGKFLIICGGEEDAASVQQALKHKNPQYTTAVVSPTNGESTVAAQIKANFDWVTSFEKVTLMLDSDEAGKQATQKAVKLLKPGQAFIANLSLKDPNEYIKIGRETDLVSAFWKAERFSPIDLMTLGQMWSEFRDGAKQSIIPLPSQFQQLNEMLGGGIAHGEVTLIGALTSVGKSAMINNLVYSFFKETDEKIGLLYLESTPREIVSNLLSIHLEENLALQNPNTLDMDRLEKEFMNMVQEDDRIVSINHQGAFASMDDLYQKIEWLCKAMDTKIVIVDPLQAAVPSNENASVEDFMDRMLKLAKQTDASIIVVSHMRKPDGKDQHDVSEYDLKGSSAINQIAFNTVLLSRDKNSDDEAIRNSTRLQVVKCRRTGFTGEAGWLRYQPYKAKMIACENPYKEKTEEDIPGEQPVKEPESF